MGHQRSSWPQKGGNQKCQIDWQCGRGLERTKTRGIVKRLQKRGAKGNASIGDIRTFEGEKQIIRK